HLVARIGRIADKKAQVLYHVGNGRLEAAVRRGNAGVEVEGLGSQHRAGAQVAGRDVAFEEVGRAVEVAGVHLQRHEEVLVDVDLEVVAGEALDDLAQENVAEVGVAPTAARGKGDVRIRQHGGDLGPMRGFE